MLVASNVALATSRGGPRFWQHSARGQQHGTCGITPPVAKGAALAAMRAANATLTASRTALACGGTRCNVWGNRRIAETVDMLMVR